jgi:Ser/Thr protein kinase RdoA (MazF antagonist)
MLLPRGLTYGPSQRGRSIGVGVPCRVWMTPGGGRRGLRAVVSAELWGVLAARWAIPRQPGRDLGGSLNLNLLVSRGAGQLVVRVHRPSVSPARLEAVQAVRDRLDAAGVPCSVLVPARDGARWAWAGDRLVEVERFIPHDGAMNTPGRLARGLPLLGRLNTLLAGMDVAPPGRTAEFANHIEPGGVLPGTRAGAARIRSWHPTPEERRTASQAERLAELVTVGEAGLAAGLPRQLTHGDFWDDNVFFRGEALVFVADFGFLAERVRIDDLALTLYYADTEFGLTGRDRIAALRPLVRGYTIGLGSPLTPAEHQALPWAIARQPLWGIGGWVVVLDDQRAARAHARATFPAIGRALDLVADISAWQAELY